MDTATLSSNDDDQARADAGVDASVAARIVDALKASGAFDAETLTKLQDKLADGGMDASSWRLLAGQVLRRQRMNEAAQSKGATNG